jgi:ribosomal protein S18 acetylase RimI-like enzyme
MSTIEYRETCGWDKEQIASLIKERWGTEYIVVHNTIYLPCNLNGFIAFENARLAGLVTYIIENGMCEIVSLDSLQERRGIGSTLVDFVINEAVKNKCTSVWLITTNDNEKAASFYRKKGFELVEIYVDTVSESRMIKPEIPLTGENGIPITDELKFSLAL